MKRWPDHYYFCTYFDYNFLARGLLLYESIIVHVPSFTLYVLALDDETYDILTAKSFSNIVPIHIRDLEKQDAELLATKSTRSLIEYYFTCSPCFPLYVLAKNLDIDILTYLDADIYFYDSPRPFYEELGNNSILVFEHGISPLQEEKYGRFNVGYLSWRNDENGLACLKWWRARCIEWCYDKPENSKFADQKYLDQWPILFKSIIISKQKTRALAPWNLERHPIECLQEKPKDLIFFHFHGVKIISHWHYSTHNYNISSKDGVKLFNVYVKNIVSKSKEYSLSLTGNIRYTSRNRYNRISFFPISFLSIAIWKYSHYILNSYKDANRMFAAYQEGSLRKPSLQAVKIMIKFPNLIFNRHILLGIFCKNLFK
jgi:hypothetical protein